MAVNTRIAFQGGGARLADLLPIVAAIQKAVDAKEIHVTHVSGASAGAVAAAIVAARVEVMQIVNQISASREAYIAALIGKSLPRKGSLRWKWALLKLFVTGRSVSNRTALKATLLKLFQDAGGAKFTEDFKLEDLEVANFTAMATDIVTCKAGHYSKKTHATDKLFDVIADSSSVRLQVGAQLVRQAARSSGRWRSCSEFSDRQASGSERQRQGYDLRLRL